uniref:DUF4220 domain-containing protein n=1 Tax=Leersia perrieri TaxID=77586 RepID=A0A0D9WRX4_9ORYZ
MSLLGLSLTGETAHYECVRPDPGHQSSHSTQKTCSFPQPETEGDPLFPVFAPILPTIITAALATLSPWLDNPRRIVVQVEALVAAAATLLLLQLILCSFRRQSSSTLIQGGAWVWYTMSFPLSSPVKNVLYPVWAVALFLVAGSTNVITSYDLDDRNQWKRNLLELLQYAFYTAINTKPLLPYSTTTSTALSAIPTILILNFIIFLTNALKVFKCWRVGTDVPTKRVAEWMKNDVATHKDRSYVFNPATLEGYKYTVRCGIRRIIANTTAKAVYHGLECAEAGLLETHDFVFKGLLSTEDDHERAFQIVEVELDFYHDYLLTKYSVIWKREKLLFFMLVTRIIFICIILGHVTQNSLAVVAPAAVIKVQTKASDTIITVFVLSAIILVEVLQAAFYLASDWAKLSLTIISDKCFSKHLKFLIEYPNNPYEKFQRYFGSGLGRKRGPVKISNTVSSLQRNGVLRQFSWALDCRSQIEIMLSCELAHEANIQVIDGGSEQEEEMSCHHEVAVNLSSVVI